MTYNNSSVTAPLKSKSTLVEFRGKTRPSKPQWRKDLSQKFHEIQKKRAQVAAIEEDAPDDQTAPLQLISRASASDVNPIVTAALKRIERARRKTGPVARLAVLSSVDQQANFSASAVVPEAIISPPIKTEICSVNVEISEEDRDLLSPLSEYETAKIVMNPVESEAGMTSVPAMPLLINLPADFTEPVIALDISDARVENGFDADGVDLPLSTKYSLGQEKETILARDRLSVSEAVVTCSEEQVIPRPVRKVMTEVIDDAFLFRLDEASRARITPEQIEDTVVGPRASFPVRTIAFFADALAVLFWTAPFAAIFELMSLNWTDVRVTAALVGVGLIISFFYFAFSVAVHGRTWGMSLLSLRVVDVRSGERPGTPQCIARTILFMLSLATLGIGFLFAIFDLESRTVHDYLSGTRIIKY